MRRREFVGHRVLQQKRFHFSAHELFRIVRAKIPQLVSSRFDFGDDISQNSDNVTFVSLQEEHPESTKVIRKQGYVFGLSE